MKKLFITFCLLLVVLAGFTQTTYYWVGGATGVFSAVTSWNTQLDGNGTAIPAAPAATDILIFDGSNIGGTTPATGQVTPSITTSYTITQLKFQNAADVVFYRFSSTGGLSSGTSAITISGDGTAAHDLTLDAGSSFKITSISYPTAQGLNVLLGAGATGSVSGTVRILDGGFAKNYLHVTSVNSLFFANGSNVYISNTFAASYAFSPSGSTAVANGVVFQSGSSLIFQGGLSPYTTTSAAIPIVFATGSNFIFEAGLGSTNNFTRHILPNVTIRNNATVNADGAPYNIDNLTIEAGATFRLGSSGGYPVTGNILNNGTFSTVAGTSNVIMLGNTPQT
ncbi:MAG TPA: hypothetical protein VLR49_14455, partial [Ferruginibacter sp.]|nr:hypothetical protein [Ferruginibacter sp.]